MDDGAREHGVLRMVALIAAGSSIYDLPYFLLGPLRPVALEVFRLSNTAAGLVMSVYGIFNLVLYLPGGSIADGLPAGALMLTGLIVTGAGGLYMASFPGFVGLCCLLFSWSLSSILIYWAAHVRCVRDTGRPEEQSWNWAKYSAAASAVGAIKLLLIVQYFSSLLPHGAEEATWDEKRQAIQKVLLIYSVLPFLASILVAFSLPLHKDEPSEERVVMAEQPFITSWEHVCRDPKAWLMAWILLSIYFCQGVNFYIPQFAMNGYGLGAVDAARIGTIGLWTKPIAALAAGRMSEKFRPSIVCAAGLGALLLLFSFMGTTAPQKGNVAQLVIYVLLLSAAGEGLSSIFWAILGEARVAGSVTGTVVGFVSFVGYSPDAFSPPFLGYILDTYPGVAGNMHCMLVGAGFALVGIIAALCLHSILPKKGRDDEQSMEEQPLNFPKSA